jgi:hypothetical protein
MAEKLHEKTSYHAAMLACAVVGAVCSPVGLYFVVVAHFSSAPAAVAKESTPMPLGLSFDAVLVCCAVLFLAALVFSVLWLIRNRRATETVLGDEEAFRKELKKWSANHNTNEVLKAGVEALDLFTPLQRDALRLSMELLRLLARLGPAPIFDASSFPDTHDGTLDSIMARWNLMEPWNDRVKASYALENFPNRVEEMRNRFVVEGISEEDLCLPIEGNNAANNISLIASTLWEMAFREGKGSLLISNTSEELVGATCRFIDSLNSHQLGSYMKNNPKFANVANRSIEDRKSRK